MASRKPEIEALAWEQVKGTLERMTWFQNLSPEEQEDTMRKMTAGWNEQVVKLGKMINDQWKAAKAEETR